MKNLTAKRRRQRNPGLAHYAFYSSLANNQATQTDPKKWLWRGLERFVNTDDSLKDYRGLAKGWPTFWPVALEDPNRDWRDKRGRSLDWCEEAHSIFILYRNILRALWTRDPATSTNGTYINLLFGLNGPVEQMKKCFPEFTPKIAMTSFWPEWGAGVVRYVSYTDFQRAIWLLFCETWRAKVCASCSLYFIAEKPAQSYCSTSCSSRAHQSSSLKWWRERGARRRAAKADRERRKR